MQDTLPVGGTIRIGAAELAKTRSGGIATDCILSRTPLQNPVVILLAVAMLAMGIRAGFAAEPQPCRATVADFQALRDNLQIVHNQVLAARDEGGPERQQAADAAAVAIRALEESVGHAIEPSPESKVIHTPRSGTKHPHMQVAKQAFSAAQHAFDDALCAMTHSPEAVRKALTDLERTLQFR